MSFTVSFCDSCRAPIIWAVSVHGNAMPVNARDAGELGNIVLHPNPSGAPLAEVLGKGQAVDGTRHTSHFATCPNAARHRKRGK